MTTFYDEGTRMYKDDSGKIYFADQYDKIFKVTKQPILKENNRKDIVSGRITNAVLGIKPELQKRKR